jgi:hypothetical protein
MHLEVKHLAQRFRIGVELSGGVEALQIDAIGVNGRAFIVFPNVWRLNWR